MNADLRKFIDELYEDGKKFDSAEAEWSRRRRNIDPPAGEFLWIFIKALQARSVIEIGTSNGYSTIWLADAVRATGGTLVSVDYDGAWLDQAQANLRGAGLLDSVELRCLEGGAYLESLSDQSVDFMFFDAERSDYARWWPHPSRVLRSGGVIAVDNSTSHPQEIADLYAQINSDGGFSSVVVPVGKGELIAVKSGLAAPTRL
ncbi:MAG: methyltransferase domain-containing protein [Actinomycetota bacterium]|nr:MAG: methyltransferase domain-containing protein [Actinomycetota bacterium]